MFHSPIPPPPPLPARARSEGLAASDRGRRRWVERQHGSGKDSRRPGDIGDAGARTEKHYNRRLHPEKMTNEKEREGEVSGDEWEADFGDFVPCVWRGRDRSGRAPPASLHQSFPSPSLPSSSSSPTGVVDDGPSGECSGGSAAAAEAAISAASMSASASAPAPAPAPASGAGFARDGDRRAGSYGWTNARRRGRSLSLERQRYKPTATTSTTTTTGRPLTPPTPLVPARRDDPALRRSSSDRRLLFKPSSAAASAQVSSASPLPSPLPSPPPPPPVSPRPSPSATMMTMTTTTTTAMTRTLSALRLLHRSSSDRVLLPKAEGGMERVVTAAAATPAPVPLSMVARANISQGRRGGGGGSTNCGSGYSRLVDTNVEQGGGAGGGGGKGGIIDGKGHGHNQRNCPFDGARRRPDNDCGAPTRQLESPRTVAAARTIRPGQRNKDSTTSDRAPTTAPAPAPAPMGRPNHLDQWKVLASDSTRSTQDNAAASVRDANHRANPRSACSRRPPCKERSFPTMAQKGANGYEEQAEVEEEPSTAPIPIPMPMPNLRRARTFASANDYDNVVAVATLSSRRRDAAFLPTEEEWRDRSRDAASVVVDGERGRRRRTATATATTTAPVRRARSFGAGEEDGNGRTFTVGTSWEVEGGVGGGAAEHPTTRRIHSLPPICDDEDWNVGGFDAFRGGNRGGGGAAAEAPAESAIAPSPPHPRKRPSPPPPEQQAAATRMSPLPTEAAKLAALAGNVLPGGASFEHLGDGPMRFAPAGERPFHVQLAWLSPEEHGCFESLKSRWDKRYMQYRRSYVFSDEMYLRFARYHRFNEEAAWVAMEKFDPRFLRLTVFALEAQLRTKTLFITPGLKTKEGYDVFYMKPARYFPKATSTKTIIDNLAYCMQVMAEHEKASLDGVAFLANMDDWKMCNFSMNYCLEFMKMLQGRVLVRVRLFLIVNPPSWFGKIWAKMKPMLSESFRKCVHIIPESDLYKFLQDGYRAYLPDEMTSGLSDTDSIVSDFIVFRKHLEWTLWNDSGNTPHKPSKAKKTSILTAKEDLFRGISKMKHQCAATAPMSHFG